MGLPLTSVLVESQEARGGWMRRVRLLGLALAAVAMLVAGSSRPRRRSGGTTRTQVITGTASTTALSTGAMVRWSVRGSGLQAQTLCGETAGGPFKP